MHKRTLFSLLVTVSVLLCAFAVSSAQNVTVQSVTSYRCATDTLNVSVTNPSTISAFEIILKISSGSGGANISGLSWMWDPGFVAWPTNRIVQIYDDTLVRVAAMLLDPGDVCLGTGNRTVGQIVYTTNNVCAGTVIIDGGTFSCPDPHPVQDITTQYVDCAMTTLIAASVTAGTITFMNQPPTIDPIADDSLHWGGTHISDANASDPDNAACEKLTFTKASGPGALTVVPTTGYISWLTTGADVGVHTVCIAVTDSCGAADTTCYEICVYNDPPEIACPVDTCPPDTACYYTSNVVWGNPASGKVCGSDPDGGPAALMYYVVSFDGPGGVGAIDINPATGEFSWATEEENAYIGLWNLCFGVTDGAPAVPGCTPRSADTCCVQIRVIPTFRVYVEKTHGTLQGHLEEVSIYLDNTINPPNQMGGFNLLVAYDRSALNFQLAQQGALLTYCGWEYFTYRTWFWPSYEPHFFWGGIIRLVAIADMNNGANHPGCFAPGPGELAVLRFMVTDNRLFECQFAPIKFFWTKCDDNTISSKSGDSLFLSRYIWENAFDTAVAYRIDNDTVPFPSYFGANTSCEVLIGDCKPDLYRIIDFFNGGVDIICAKDIDDRGDINLNGLSNEVADAVLFTNYFIYGQSVFHINLEGQMAATDVNADGLRATVGDLVYLVRIIVGDAIAYSKVTTPVQAGYLHSHDGTLKVIDNIAMGAALVVVDGDVTPTLLADNMEMKYAFDGVNTRILVYSLEGHSFTGEFVNVPGTVVSIEMATRDGNPVVAELIPTEFALYQNYPNPFNPATKISFALPLASQYTLTIYNVSGQEVARFSDAHEAGVVELNWDAADLASGIYFYKLQAGDFSATKKMVLLK
ncbi:MAG TPA: T9SS type A sorting domain-containing protein [Candidatus Deferrimicrobium sp.]|nr:T9SS type A sorting domain-containing protein [Candidatus Deferrimicrobium sp.]